MPQGMQVKAGGPRFLFRPRKCRRRNGALNVRERVPASVSIRSRKSRSITFILERVFLSFGTAGCNLGCKFCQNWEISKSREVERLSQYAEPDAVATAAMELGCRSVAFTYNDPVVWAEYAIDTAKACRERGVKTVAVTAGYIMPEARQEFYRWMDAANVDLKGFTEDFYWKITNSHLQRFSIRFAFFVMKPTFGSRSRILLSRKPTMDSTNSRRCPTGLSRI